MIFLPVVELATLGDFLPRAAKVCLPRGPPGPLVFWSVPAQRVREGVGSGKSEDPKVAACPCVSLPVRSLPCVAAPVCFRQSNVFIFDGT